MAKTPLQRALKAFGGKQTRLAEAIGTSQQNISNWVRLRKPLPAEYVLRAEQVTGISRHDWRPDIYPAEQDAAA